MTDEIEPRLLKRATQAFGNEEKARPWLARGQHCFQDVSPLEYAATGPRHMAIVMDHLARIEHGIYPGY